MDTKRLKTDCQNAPKGECPVCFQIPRANIYQCVNGHSMCDKCSKKITVCPTCQNSGVKIRNLLAESLLDDIKFKCTWNNQGCKKTMLRRELAVHEDICDHNPDFIKFCSTFLDQGVKCEFKFIPKWLSVPENCTEFFNHMETRHGYVCKDDVKIGSPDLTEIALKGIQLTVSEAPILVHHYFKPIFYRLGNPNGGEDQLFFRVTLLKRDKFGNKNLFWVLVQLTPEITPILAKITINEPANSKMVAQWGQHSVPTLSWTVKPLCFNDFTELFEELQNTDTVQLFPFTLPVSLLSEYYVDENTETFSYTMTFELKA